MATFPNCILMRYVNRAIILCITLTTTSIIISCLNNEIKSSRLENQNLARKFTIIFPGKKLMMLVLEPFSTGYYDTSRALFVTEEDKSANRLFRDKMVEQINSSGFILARLETDSNLFINKKIEKEDFVNDKNLLIAIGEKANVNYLLLLEISYEQQDDVIGYRLINVSNGNLMQNIIKERDLTWYQSPGVGFEQYVKQLADDLLERIAVDYYYLSGKSED